MLDWVINLGVVEHYARTDLDAHARQAAHRLGLRGTGAALLTAMDVTAGVRGEDGGVTVHATVGVTRPTWAADDVAEHEGEHRRPGTINVVVQLPVALTPAAAVNAVITATEAKAQALFEPGIAGTGTATDAVVVCWPPTCPPTPSPDPGRSGVRGWRGPSTMPWPPGSAGRDHARARGCPVGQVGLAERRAVPVRARVLRGYRVRRRPTPTMARARRAPLPGDRSLDDHRGRPRRARRAAHDPRDRRAGRARPVGALATAFDVDAAALCDALRRRAGDTVVVSEEVGWGCTPVDGARPAIPRCARWAQSGGGGGRRTRCLVVAGRVPCEPAG